MPLRHGMMDGDEMLILHIPDGHHMRIIGIFRFQRRQCNAAAADDGITQSIDGVSADGTDTELGAKHIGGNVPVDDVLQTNESSLTSTVRLGLVPAKVQLVPTSVAPCPLSPNVLL